MSKYQLGFEQIGAKDKLYKSQKMYVRMYGSKVTDSTENVM